MNGWLVLVIPELAFAAALTAPRAGRTFGAYLRWLIDNRRAERARLAEWETVNRVRVEAWRAEMRAAHADRAARAEARPVVRPIGMPVELGRLTRRTP